MCTTISSKASPVRGCWRQRERRCGGEEIGSDSSAERCKVLQWLANLPGLGRLVFSVPSWRKGKALLGSPFKPPGPRPQGETQTHRLAVGWRGRETVREGWTSSPPILPSPSTSSDHPLQLRPLLSHRNTRVRQRED